MEESLLGVTGRFLENGVPMGMALEREAERMALSFLVLDPGGHDS